MRRSIPVCLALLLTVTGCQELGQTQAQTLSPHAQRVLDDIGRLSFHDPNPPDWDTTTQEERNALFADRRALHHDIVGVILEARDLAQAHEGVVRVLATSPAADDPVIHQMTAAALLKAHFIPLQETSEITRHAPLARSYADQLMDTGSPEVVTVHRAIETFDRAGLRSQGDALVMRTEAYIETYGDRFVGCIECRVPVPRADGAATDDILVEPTVRALRERATAAQVAAASR